MRSAGSLGPGESVMTIAPIVIERILQSLALGLLIGSVYGLLCLGLGLIFGVMRVVNFAQGEFMMLGMYGTMGIVLGISAYLDKSMAAYPAAIAAALAVGLFGGAVQRMLLAPLADDRVGPRSERQSAQLILTLGLSLVIQSIALVLMGSSAVAVRSPLSSKAWEIELVGGMSVFLNKARVVAAILAAAIALLAYIGLQRLPIGRQLRAAADDPDAATYCGVSVDRAHLLAFAVGTGLTALAGGLIATNYPFNPFVGLDFIVVMYAGVVLGGMGSIAGAFWGGMTIGLVQQTADLVLPTQLQNTAIFVVFLLVIILRPQGFFGRSVDRA
jgi:branched-chain amino acid transport system permease protein